MASSPATSATHYELQADLAGMLRLRRPRPIVASEIAVDGNWGDQGRVDVIALVIGTGYRTTRLDGFEVKANRADWLRELAAEKWTKSLPYFDRFWIAVPDEVPVVQPGELPAAVGLMVRKGPGVWRPAVKAPKLTPDRSEGTWLRMLRRLDDELTRALQPRADRLDRMRRYERYAEERALGPVLSNAFAREKADLDSRRRMIDAEIRDLERARDTLRIEVDQLKTAAETLADVSLLVELADRAVRPLPMYGDGAAQAARREEARALLHELASKAVKR